MQYLLLLHGNSGFANVPQYYIVCTLPVLLLLETSSDRKNIKHNNNKRFLLQGFEHLLENLGLGRLVFEKKHTLSLHKMNGSFQDVHDTLSLHRHSHNASTRRKRQVEGASLQ
jgi:hypothetical protein